MKKRILWFIVIALTAALALACKDDEDSSPQKKLVITDIPGTYNTLKANITLTQLTTKKAEGTAVVSGGSATFALVDVDGNSFTEGGLTPYQATLTIFDANGTTVGGYIGVLAVFITQETTTVSFGEFIGKGTGL
jgi:hypothetical protein